MAELMPDQAAGLRRMFARSMVRTVTLTSGKAGTGRSVIAGNLAAALARRGQSVCVLDQNRGRRSVSEQMGVVLPHDLADVVRRDRLLADVLVSGPDGVRFVGAAEAVRLLGSLPEDEEVRLTRAFGSLQPAIDVMLVDAPSAESAHAPCYTLASAEVIVVVSGEADAITEAYSLIKRLTWDFARRRFHVLVNRVRTEEQAGAIFDNLAGTARRYLGVELASLGWIPEDDILRKAVRLRQTVVGAFPEAPSSAALHAIADTVMQWPYAGEDCLDGFVQRLVQASRIASLSASA
ncbi:MAG: P-loop NTPase [Burkholderiales bacterium]|nr:P-loop NTPase [Burkholderiales bacterium]